MNYRNIDLKIDQFVAYLNEDKINLIPPFQRGHVWNLPTRRKLIQNIVEGRPIPAIFLYRESAGSRYAYNILDGKQRLESLILFIGNREPSLKIDNISKYFFDKKLRDSANFKVELGKKKVGLPDLDEELLRDFQEYVLPTIEITLNEDDPTALDEMISLFVDINSYGEVVKRFDIVKAMSKDALLRSAFSLVALKETRGKDVFYKSKKNDITRVLQRLQVVNSINGANAQVDRMWELLVEIVLFLRTKKHRNPVEILKSFIRAPEQKQRRCSGAEEKILRRIFGFLRKAYKNERLVSTRLATNQIHFYTMITSIISGDLLKSMSETELIRKLMLFGEILDEKRPVPNSIKKTMREYRELSEKQTTHVGRRESRQNDFLLAIDAL
jgi:hypothetical protein